MLTEASSIMTASISTPLSVFFSASTKGSIQPLPEMRPTR
jgi:hypothetical protein